jgi:hypothetical protein
MPSQISASSSTVSSENSQPAMKAPLTAPTEVATIASGVMARSASARSIPTWIAPRPAPPESTNAAVMPFSRVAPGVSYLVSAVRGEVRIYPCATRARRDS